jgi:FlaA1/EpsC-like NDP-sugar epimerase
MSADASIIVAALLGAFCLRFEFDPPASELSSLPAVVITALVTKSIVFIIGGCHKGSWRHAGMFELVQTVTVNLTASLVFATVTQVGVSRGFPRSVYIIDFVLCAGLMCAIRAASRVRREIFQLTKHNPSCRRILIYGTGVAATALLREIRSNPALNLQVTGILDDDPDSVGLEISGARVLGQGRNLASIVEKCRSHGERIDEVVIALPAATGREMREALSNCRAAGVQCRTIPNVAEILSGRVLVSQIRDLRLEDLLGRAPAKLSTEPIRRSIEGACVLITGGGGSIGAEICRQVADFRPKKLVILDRAESDLFKIHWEISARHPELSLAAEIADIREYDRIDDIVGEYEITSIFHAAAYKHVPLMETHAVEAVRNNVIGTYNVVTAAIANRVQQCAMISSDKAVNPTNIMGLTKRAAEIIVSSLPTVLQPGIGTKCVSVRFGNVLGSNGSVIPLFQQQIATGGPVTVTHPDVRRYFMTIREAVQLVLQASTMGRGSEIFVLDMGEPVRIIDLARNMIRLSGQEPDVDIEIRITGLRPGEKLFEELLLEHESVLPTSHQDIRVIHSTRRESSEIEEWLCGLRPLLARRDSIGVLRALKAFVKEYQPSDVWKEMLDEERTAIAS